MTKLQKSTKKSAFADFGSLADPLIDWPDTLERTLPRATRVVNRVCRRELNPVDLGYQANLANLPSPHQLNCSTQKLQLYDGGAAVRFGPATGTP